MRIFRLQIHIFNLQICIFRLKIENFWEEKNFMSGVGDFSQEVGKFCPVLLGADGGRF